MTLSHRRSGRTGSRRVWDRLLAVNSSRSDADPFSMQGTQHHRRTVLATSAAVAGAVVLIGAGTAGLEREAVDTAWNELTGRDDGRLSLPDRAPAGSPAGDERGAARIVAQLRTASGRAAVVRRGADPQAASQLRREVTRRAGAGRPVDAAGGAGAERGAVRVRRGTATSGSARPSAPPAPAMPAAPSPAPAVVASAGAATTATSSGAAQHTAPQRQPEPARTAATGHQRPGRKVKNRGAGGVQGSDSTTSTRKISSATTAATPTRTIAVAPAPALPPAPSKGNGNRNGHAGANGHGNAGGHRHGNAGGHGHGNAGGHGHGNAGGHGNRDGGGNGAGGQGDGNRHGGQGKDHGGGNGRGTGRGGGNGRGNGGQATQAR
jgi:hypothetical protein